MIPQTVEQATEARRARIAAYQAKLPGEVADLERRLAELTEQIQSAAPKTPENQSPQKPA